MGKRTKQKAKFGEAIGWLVDVATEQPFVIMRSNTQRMTLDRKDADSLLNLPDVLHRVFHAKIEKEAEENEYEYDPIDPDLGIFSDKDDFPTQEDIDEDLNIPHYDSFFITLVGIEVFPHTLEINYQHASNFEAIEKVAEYVLKNKTNEALS